jgi:hypothetical protein
MPYLRSADVAPNFIVMSSHGRSGLSRLILGSVAEEVLRHAVCPVLIVKQSAGKQLCTSKEMASSCRRA